MINFEQFFQNLPSFNNISTKRISQVWAAFFQQLYENPSLWWSVLQSHQTKQMEIFTSLRDSQPPSIAPAKSDRRFSAEQWTTNPFFSMLMQNYLLNSEVLRELVESANLPEKDKEILRFSLEQYVSAMSPTNFPVTNPEVVEEAIKTGGDSLKKGMQNMLEDTQQHGMVKNTDMEAFEIGKDIAVTPGKVVFENPLMQIIEYAPQTPKVYAHPLLIVPPCINKYYILDLTEQKSLAGHLVAEGHRVFMISWVNADTDIAHITWDDYLREGIMTAIETVSSITKQDKINALGFCVGGTMLVSALAALAAHDEHPVASLTLLAAMIDFSDTGQIGLFINEESVAEDEKKYLDGGIMDGKDLARGFSFLRPDDLIWPYVIDSYYKGKSPQAFDLLFWNSDSTNLPGPMFAQYLRMTYLENQIFHGKAEMCGTTIKPEKIKAPVCAIACEKDHIVPWDTAYSSARLINRKAHFILAASGHIAGIVNPPAKNKGWHLCASKDGTLPANAETWKTKAARHDGSWWTHWFAWLKTHAGRQVAAPKRRGSVLFPPLEDAPGSYVTAPKPVVNEHPTQLLFQMFADQNTPQDTHQEKENTT